MVYKVTSSDRVIARVFRDFKPNNSAWVKDAIEWIGEGLEIIGSYAQYERKPICVKIIDYKGKLPCELESIEGVEYDGHRLPYSSATNSVANCCANLPVHSTEYCSFNPNYIQTSFPTGEVIIYAQVLPTDNKGFPMIPDDALTIIALSWKVMAALCLRGLTHPVINFEKAEAMWEKFYPQAQNSDNFPDIENYEQFKRRWVNVALNINVQDEMFNDFINIQTRKTETGSITSE